MKDQEPVEWIAKRMKLLKRWLPSEEGVDKVLSKIVMKQFLNGLPQELRIWLASNQPETPAKVAELVETINSGHIQPTTGNSEKPRYHHIPKPTLTKDSLHQWRRSRGSTQVLIEKRPFLQLPIKL